MKLFLTFAMIYLLILLLSFLSEVTYKKRTIAEVKNDAKSIIKKASIVYIVFIGATVFYHLAGVNFND